MSATLQSARRYLAAGYSVIPVKLDGSKAPAVDWGPFQKRHATEDELAKWFPRDDAHGIGLVQGSISGNAEMLEFETAEALAQWEATVRDHGREDLLDRLNLRVRSGGGGIHFYYRCPDGIEGNQKLALFSDKTVKIETRGEGGQVVACGSPKSVHKSGNPYAKLSGSFESVPTVTGEERAFLFAMAKSLNEHKPSGKTFTPKGAPAPSSKGSSLRPGDDFNDKATQAEVIALLEAHGWQVAGGRGEVCDMTRPGKSTSDGSSGTVGYCGPNGFYCFTSSAPPFEPETYYDPFGLYCLLEHGGDFAKATKALGEKGYGEPIAKTTSAEKGKGFAERQEQAEERGSLVRLGDFNQTDAGNAERLILRNGEDLRHVPGLGWRVWNGKHWTANESTVTAYARDTIRALYAEAADLLTEAHKEPDRETRKQLAASAEALSRFAIKSESTRALAAMVDQAKSFSQIMADAHQFNLKPWVVPFQNGVWDRGKWRGHQRTDYAEHLLPVCYDPHADRSEWLAVLKRMTGGDARFAQTLQDVAGYCLSGASTLRLLPWAYGPKGTGKSTFAELLQTTLGAAGKTLDSTLLSGDRESERLGAAVRSMRAVFLPESGRKRLDAELLKMLTGSDRIPCRLLYSSLTFSVMPSWAVFAVANDPPAMNAHDEALRDRVVALPFVHRLDQGEELVFRDGKRLEEVRRKADSALVEGFVAWAVEGLERVHAAQDVYRAPVVGEHTQRFWDETDPLTPFWEGLDPNELEKGMGSSALHRTYLAWCEKEGTKRPLQGRAFAAACRAAGLEDVRGTGGVRLWKRPHPSMKMPDEPANSDRVTDNTPFSEKFPKKESIEDFTKNGPESVTLSLNEDEDDLPDPYANTPGGANYRSGEEIIEVRL